MGRNWTEEQKQVVAHSEGDLLVAAAAGSGKTAVLVERIVTMIREKQHPIDIDRMLVVTFTKAAATEMKERVGRRIAELIAEEPDNELLQRQQRLLHHASITTLDSFCLQIVKEFFHQIDLDPGFRIGDEAEMKLLQSDVLKELLEENYAEARSEFLRFTECYASGKTDVSLEEYILRMFRFSESDILPEKWLAGQTEAFEYKDIDAFANSSLLADIMTEVQTYVSLALTDAREAENCAVMHNVTGYLQVVQEDVLFLQTLAGLKDYRSFAAQIRAHQFGRAKASKKDVSPDAVEYTKELRNRYKETVQNLIEWYFYQDMNTMYEDMEHCAGFMRELVHLTLEFRKKYSKAKTDKNLLDFPDLSHYALEILLQENEDGKVYPSEAAKVLRSRFDRIMVDEYQDSNQIQETLLWAISRLHDGKPNVFMVGDVKQSIYRFRQARPELFMEKYAKYGQGDAAYQKIVLKKNFRSRAQVLDAVNSVFEWCMYKEFGGIEYDADAALHVGLTFDDNASAETAVYEPELLVLYAKETNADVKNEENDVEEKPENPVAEAMACADRILRLVQEEKVQITKEGQKKAIRFGDIAILLRSAKGWVEPFVSVLRDRGIPAKASVASGFFEAGEVVTILNYLRILDNPKQDIPFAQVMLSALGGFTNSELAEIKCCSGKLYDVMKLWVRKGESVEELLHKAERFLDEYNYFRERKKYLGVAELIQEIYQRTGFYTAMAALPAGEQRIANLEYLLRHAKSYEATSYHGLFRFVRYVEKLKENEVDFGEASTADAGDAVRIMTIHKSKGLEFPVVLIPGCAKGFNQMDLTASVVLHPDYGLGPEWIDSETRTRIPSLKKAHIKRVLKQETIAEELRLLYVAMTRAKEKLILVGSIDRLDKFLISCKESRRQMDYRKLAAADSYLDFIKGSILREAADMDVHVLNSGGTVEKFVVTTGQRIVWHFLFAKAGSVSVETVEDALKIKERKDALLELMQHLDTMEETPLYRELKETVQFSYPFAQATVQPVKTSVSELKRRQLQEEGEQEAAVPVWLRKRKKKTGTEEQSSGIDAAQKGTLYHKMLELMPVSEVTTREAFEAFRDDLTECGRMTREEADCIETEKIVAFLESSLAARIRKADADKKVKREQAFVLGIEASDGSGDYELIQGIIDLYFEEDDGVILVDYKSDRVENPEELAERYRIQLAYYAQAIEQITGKKVKEKIIYSLHLSETISAE